MGYLVLNDYNSVIQGLYYTQLTQGNENNRLKKENLAQTEMISFLIQKFDCATEFAATTVFAYLTKYSANALVELNFVAYDATKTYVLNSLVNYQGGQYYCTTAIVVPEVFTPGHWTQIGNIYDLWYLNYPYPLFDVNHVYNVGDRVYWKGKIYQNLIATVPPPDTQGQEQYGTYKNLPNLNIFPDDPKNGLVNWGNGTPYTVTSLIPNQTAPAAWAAGTYTQGQRAVYNGTIWECIVATTTAIPGADIINWQPETWVLGDNRNSQLVQYMIYLVIWYMSDTLAPQNKPKYWKDNYDKAIGWLKMAAQGDITPSIPKIQPATGGKIRFGGQIKQQNGY